MLAEILITNWPSAITVLGVTAMLGYVLLTFIKGLFTLESSTQSVREIIDSEPTWKETKVTTIVDDEAIKEVLKEMGYDVAVERAATAASISAVTKAMERDYSTLMKKIDDIRASTPSTPVDAGFPYVSSTTTGSGPGDACH